MSQSLPQKTFWDETRAWSVPHTSWTLKGHSRAMERTGFYLVEPKIMLDGGVALPSPEASAPHALCITHGHIDHSNGLPMLLRHSLSDGAGPMHILAPRSIMPRLVDFGQMSWAIKVDYARPLPPVYASAPSSFVDDILSVTGGTPLLGPTYNPETKGLGNCKAWVPMDPGSSLSLMTGRKAASGKGLEIFIETMEMDHSTPTLGYLLAFDKQGLKPEFQVFGLDGALDKRATGEAVRKAKSEGLEVTANQRVFVLGFLCDTRSSILWDPAKRAILQHYSTLMIECTYLDANDEEIDVEEEAERRGHVCWVGPKGLGSAIKSWYSSSSSTKTWILMHFSLRYKDEEILEFFLDPLRCAMVLERTTDPQPLLLLWLDSGLISLAPPAS